MQGFRRELAQVYPRGVCQQLALTQIRFGNASVLCAGGTTSRFGEAAVPGPPFKKVIPQTDSLIDYNLVEPATAKLQDTAWREFERWLLTELDSSAVVLLLDCPQLFVVLLAEYGHVAYKEGRPLHLYRQLLAFCQREYFGLKAYIGSAWDVVTHWELAEPTRHRPPVPEPLLQAMLGLATGLGWKRFSEPINAPRFLLHSTPRRAPNRKAPRRSDRSGFAFRQG